VASASASRRHRSVTRSESFPAFGPAGPTHNTYTWIGDPSNCCVLGYHGATSSLNGNGNQQVQTYVYSAFITPRSFRDFDQPGSGLGDIQPLSHRGVGVLRRSVRQ